MFKYHIDINQLICKDKTTAPTTQITQNLVNNKLRYGNASVEHVICRSAKPHVSRPSRQFTRDDIIKYDF